jgi:hypothetical protein
MTETIDKKRKGKALVFTAYLELRLQFIIENIAFGKCNTSL